MNDIKEILKDAIEQRNIGIVPLLRREGLVKRLNCEIFDNLDKDHENISMISLCRVGPNDYNLDYIANLALPLLTI